MKLYEISQDMKELALLAEADNLDVQMIEDTMSGIEAEFNDKAINIVYVVNNFNSDITALDTEINRLNALKKTVKNQQESLRDYLRLNMEATGISKIECPLFKITLAKGRDIVQIDNEEKIPDNYLNVITTIKPMKKEILAALKKGEVISGASMVKSQQSLRIK